MFNISESYANKIYHKISNIIIKIAHVKGAKSVAEGNIKDIVIDVCEQQIERPKKGQKDYYSGKKTTYKWITIHLKMEVSGCDNMSPYQAKATILVWC